MFIYVFFIDSQYLMITLLVYTGLSIYMYQFI